MTTNDSSDSELIRLCAAGDKRAWDIFVGRFSKLIYWSIHRTLGRRSEKKAEFADEIFQDIFKKLLEKAQLKKLQSVQNIKKYLIVLACHTTLDRLKTSGRLQARTGQSLSEIEEIESLIPTDSADGALVNERQRLLDSVMNLLNEKEKACLEFCYVYDRTHKEIAALMDLPQDTVSTLIRRTKEKLREAIRAEGLNEADF